MKYCAHCGAQLNDESVICVKCGCPVGDAVIKSPAKNDASSFGFAVLCFLMPTVGLILWLLWKDEYPKKAKSCGVGALVGLISGTVGGILYGIFGAIFSQFIMTLILANM